MTMRDAARAASVSHCFLRSWRRHSNLDLDAKTLRATKPSHPIDHKAQMAEESATIEDQESSRTKRSRRTTMEFVARVDRIMRSHAGAGVRTFRLRPPLCSCIDSAILDHWIRAAIMPGIRVLELQELGMGYSFSCSLLSSDSSSSLTSLTLTGCRFRCDDDDGASVLLLTSLRSVYLRDVRVTDEELNTFLSRCPALKQMEISRCHGLVSLGVPHHLTQLKSIQVLHCDRLETIECDASKLVSLGYVGAHVGVVSLGRVRELEMLGSDEAPAMLCHAIAELPSVAPNLRSLFLSSYFELGMEENVRHEDYTLRDTDEGENSSQPQAKRRLHKLKKLKNVIISGFCSGKGMIELTRNILENAPSLNHMILDTTYGFHKNWLNSSKNHHRCMPLMTRNALMEAKKAMDDIRRHIIKGKVPSSDDRLKIIKPCRKCQTSDKKEDFKKTWLAVWDERNRRMSLGRCRSASQIAAFTI
ncbi:hypothetical protein E2562_031323 [Oryza meyeriana var. granulata]|uniref:At1g61320/AtMIF1 LRR domain-containing protein n=1 Tax=Oryza meyeriana var. granulata TaxID=110450 RepID=A0A6G1CBL6_9ORYZ|nr:hypothetical protein E2562_031323 [Oryza meyeriana var. granulata]